MTLFSEDMNTGAVVWKEFFEEMADQEFKPPTQNKNESPEDYQLRCQADKKLETLRRMCASTSNIRAALAESMWVMFDSGEYMASTLMRNTQGATPSDFLREIQEFIGMDVRWSSYTINQFNSFVLRVLPALKQHGIKIDASTLATLLDDSGNATISRVVRNAISAVAKASKSGTLSKKDAETIGEAITGGSTEAKEALQELVTGPKQDNEGSEEEEKIVAECYVKKDHDVWQIKVPKNRSSWVEAVLAKYFETRLGA